MNCWAVRVDADIDIAVPQPILVLGPSLEWVVIVQANVVDEIVIVRKSVVINQAGMSRYPIHEPLADFPVISEILDALFNIQIHHQSGVDVLSGKLFNRWPPVWV